MNAPDLISTSGREDLPIKARIDLLRAALLGEPFTGITNEPARSQVIHDIKLTAGWINNTIQLYERALARGETEETLAPGADRMLSWLECLVFAWRRGGHNEYNRVRKEQRTRGL